MAAVYPVATYHAAADTVPALVGAVPLWGADRSTAGQGVKVGIIDDGIDASAPFLAPAGLRAAAGLPARAAALHERPRDRRAQLRRPGRARAPTTSRSTPTSPSTGRTSRASSPAPTAPSRAPGSGCRSYAGSPGVAPGAWLGNYRGLARGDHESGAIGSTVELAAAVDRAVADGMDVLNLSLGGPQIDPSADALSMALANAARAGVPSVVAAGNELRLARLRLDLVARHERDGDHGRRDVDGTRVFGVSGTRQRRRHGRRSSRSLRCRRSARA